MLYSHEGPRSLGQFQRVRAISALSFNKRSFRIAVAAGKMRAAVPSSGGASSVVEQRAQSKKLRLKLLKIPLQQPVGQSAFIRRG
jgi:hypothetical protein